MTKTKTKASAAVTCKVDGETLTLFMGTSALIHMEQSMGTALADIKDVLSKPSLSQIRDIVAALLVEHHPQAVDNQVDAMTNALMKLTGTNGPKPIHWPSQQALAGRCIDAVGMHKVGDLMAAAFESSPHFDASAVTEPLAA